MKRIIFILLFLIAQGMLCAQEMKFTFDHFAINVRDLDKSVAFYQKYFFVEEIYDGTEAAHIRWFSLGNNQELHIITVKDLDVNVPKGIHMALTTPDLNRYIDFLEANQVDYYDWPGAKGKVSTRPDKIQQIYVQDPDGYWIEVNNGITRFDQ